MADPKDELEPETEEPGTGEVAESAPKQTYKINEGGSPLTQYDSEGKATVYNPGDTIELTEAEAESLGDTVVPAADEGGQPSGDESKEGS